ncbi:hypothetical protein ACXZD7_002946 [Escherichia coli]
MQKKTLLSACIAIALSGQSWGAEITEGESADSMRRSSQMTCQSEGHARPSTKLKTVPEKCAVVTNNGFSSLLALGATAVLTTLAVIELSHDNDHSAHSFFSQPIPPDDNGPLPPPLPSDEDSDIPVSQITPMMLPPQIKAVMLLHPTIAMMMLTPREQNPLSLITM